MTVKYDNYIKKIERIRKELEGRITNEKEADVYIQLRLEGMEEVGAIEMLNSFGIKELEAIARFRRLYSHYLPNELAEQNKRYREALEFYADEYTYKEVRHEPAYMGGVPIEPPYGEPPLIYYDNYGEKARKALGGDSDE